MRMEEAFNELRTYSVRLQVLHSFDMIFFQVKWFTIHNIGSVNDLLLGYLYVTHAITTNKSFTYSLIWGTFCATKDLMSRELNKTRSTLFFIRKFWNRQNLQLMLL